MLYDYTHLHLHSTLYFCCRSLGTIPAESSDIRLLP